MALRFNGKPKINPGGINLLVFDLDGTLFQSDMANIEAVKKALFVMHPSISIKDEDIVRHLGEPSERFYKNILPADKLPFWEEFRAKAREQCKISIPKFGKLFPGVADTLAVLKKRGYTLALYSNCSVGYFDNVLSAFDLRQYFDFIECNQENNLNKVDLIKKMRSQFPRLNGAVIGDRGHDIDAGAKNGLLSIGVLFGYGRKEPEKADITIDSFPELLEIFDRKLPIFERILSKIEQKKRKDRAFVVGVNGIDTSGKTKFAEALGKFLLSRKHKIQVINLDDFHNPKEIRYSGDNQAENYYNKSFDIKTIINKLLIPIHRKSEFNIELDTLNLQTDKYETKKSYAFDKDTIVIFEGVFLFRKELSPFIDYKIFIEIPLKESKNRAIARDVPLYGEEVMKKYDEKYLPAQIKYIKEFPPSEIADMIIENTNWEKPVINYEKKDR